MKETLPQGLTNAEAAQREANGLANIQPATGTRSYKDIFMSNIFTFFNFLNVVLLVLVLSVHSYKNGLFFMIVLINTAAGIFQEIRTKRTLDKLRILNAQQVDVLREGQTVTLPVHKLVQGDLFMMRTGAQVPADCTVIQGSAEANEGLLTGESVSVAKSEGDTLLSGSYITAGEAVCRADKVGAESYSARLTGEAQSYRKHPSALRHSLNRILQVVSILIIPIGALLFCKQYYWTGGTLRDAVVHTVAAVLGMIPEGLVLLSSIALALGVIHLAKRRTLVQELYCIETLARVDVLCLDKTGTLTEGRMALERTVPLADGMADGMQRLLGVLDDKNATADALHAAYRADKNAKAQRVIPFSSARKYSGAVLNDGTWLIGAVQFIFPDEAAFPDLRAQCAGFAADGYRVLVLAHSTEAAAENALPNGLAPIGILLLSDVIRPSAKDTLDFFAKQGVTLKVISGDDAATAGAVAQRAGLADAAAHCVDATTLKTDADIAAAMEKYTVFGRVTPQQKKAMVLALKKAGHTVAMTGDGVNDVPALKAADCSVAMAAGADAAKSCANLVLLDSDFASMPHIVNEGRRVINNIRMAGSMFLIKTIFSGILATLSIFVGAGYPFEPIQMSLIGACSTGLPTFLLQLEPNFTRVGKGFLRHMLAAAMPHALTVVASVLLAMAADSVFGFMPGGLAAVCTVVTGCIYTSALYRVYRPLSRWRKCVIIAAQVLFILCLVVGHSLFNIVVPHRAAVITCVVLCALSFCLVEALSRLNAKLQAKLYHV